MSRKTKVRLYLFALSSGGWLMAGSCYTNAFENLDLFLSRNATDALTRLPYSVVGPLLEAVLQAVNFF